jgi:transcriptional regulator GlxA family with amidase domain
MAVLLHYTAMAESAEKQTESAEPFRVGFLLVSGFALMSYAAAVEPLRAANLLAGEPLYELTNIAAIGGSGISSSGAVIDGDDHRTAGLRFDLVLVVAGGDPAEFSDKSTFDWLAQLSARGVLLGGVSGGPVILARAGLMRGRRLTVHWEHANALTEFDPNLLVERSLYVRDRDRLTCAGGTAPLDMMHILIADHHGPDFATRVSDWFLHTDVRPSGGPQRAGLVERYGTTSRPVVQAIEAMENHIGNPLSLNQLASRAGVGARQLNRLFASKLGCSAMSFYLKLRLEKSRNLLDQSPLSVTEIALATGFSSSAHFSRAFSNMYEQTPSSVRL